MKQSSMHDFYIAMEIINGGKIFMRGGKIYDVDHAVIARSQSSVFLEDVDVLVRSVSLRSIGSGITMIGGKISLLDDNGAAVIVDTGGSVALDGVTVSVEKDRNEYRSNGFMIQNGFISFDRGTFTGSRVSVLSIFGDNKADTLFPAPTRNTTTTENDSSAKSDISSVVFVPDSSVEDTTFAQVSSFMNRSLGSIVNSEVGRSND
ncbi:hypothetical protein, partial [Bartonella tribocorum]|uniref:hypothetical protein n=1 Tax=Bartonella tribocorum TaxID=85701 RepID=UPI001ABBAC29